MSLFFSFVCVHRTKAAAMPGSQAGGGGSSSSQQQQQQQASVHNKSNNNHHHLAKNKILCYNQLSANELLTGPEDSSPDKQSGSNQDLSYSSSSSRRSPSSSSRLGILWTIFAISVLICSGYFFRDYIQRLLASVEDQNDFTVFPILILLYVLVSMPFAWGYLIINIATGYMYGLWRGLLVTMITSISGIVIAHFVIKRFMVTFVKK